ncbi:MAG TPA: GlsB/YeaQ/YmgE family stress response membrane protein [Blastocatellia bacterium]|nr:GlsB/YeaQ/YmgE family stress response membrane protein [Blastocatellia bacterium]
MGSIGDLIWMMLTGLVIGIIAKIIMPGKDPGGIIVTALIGMVGSLVGTFIGRALFNNPRYEASWAMAIIGSLILLGLYRVFFGRRKAS